MLAVAAGCSGGGGGDSATPSGPQAAADDDFLFTVSAALSEGQLTVNNRWTQADLDAQHINVAITYEGLNQPAGRVRPYTMTVQEYRVRLEQCKEDFNKFYPPVQYTPPVPFAVTYTIVDRKCYPTLTDLPYLVDPIPDFRSPAAQILKRYGYYSGGGFPPDSNSTLSPFREGMPEPLDPADYCSRLHDQGAWAGQIPNLPGHPNECGIVMCLAKASGLPANLMVDLLPEVEKSRKHWYDGAANDLVCAGNQGTLPPPILGP